MTIKRPSHDLVVIFCGIVAAMHIGKLPPSLPILRDEFGLSLLQAGFLLSLVQLAGIFFGLVIGLFAEKIGLKRSMLIGLTVLGLASVAGAFAHTASGLLWLRAIEGGGFLLAAITGPGLVRRYVDAQHLSIRLGLWSTYMPVGMATAFLISSWVIDAAGWSALWWFTGGLTLVMALWLALAVPTDPPRPADHSGSLSILILTLTHRGPWLVALCFALYGFQWLSVIGFLPTIFIENGYGSHLTGVLISCATLSNIIGNFSAGKLLHRGVPAQRLLYVGFSAMLISTFVIFYVASPSPIVQTGALVAFAAIGGLVPGAVFSLAVRAAPSDHAVSSTMGLMQQLLSLGLFCGPPVTAWVASHVGGWHLSWLVTGACALMGCVVAHQLMHTLRRIAT